MDRPQVESAEQQCHDGHDKRAETIGHAGDFVIEP
jgi:hypothetical protein